MAQAVSAAASDKPHIQLSPGRRNAVLGAVLLGLFLAALDQTVVGTALPRIVTDLHGNNLYTWVVTSYLLSSTISVPIYGKLSDVYGRKIMLLAGIVIFLAGSALSGLSQDMTQLIAFRGLQGVGAGALFPIALAVIGDLFTPRERGRYQGVFGGVFGLSFIIGPFVGGWITDNISWHWVFYVNLPIGLAALAVIVGILPNFHPDIRTSARDLDYLGILVFTAAVVPILLGLTNKVTSSGKLNAWTDPSVGGLIVLGLALVGVFLFIESRAKQPIIPLSLFRSKTISATNTAVFLVAFGMFASIIFLPRYYQAVRGYSATDSGYLIWPLLVGLIGSSIVSGIVISRIGKYKLILLGSMCIFVIGAFVMTSLNATSSDAHLWLGMLLIGLGIGPSMSGFTVVVQNCVSAQEMGVATSTLTFLRQIGGSVGLAISGTLFGQTFATKVPQEFAAQGLPRAMYARFATHGTGSGGQQSLTGVGLAAQLHRQLPPGMAQFIPKIVTAIHDAFSVAIGQIFWLTVWSGVAALVATLLIAEVPLRGAATPVRGSVPSAPEDELPVYEAAAR